MNWTRWLTLNLAGREDEITKRVAGGAQYREEGAVKREVDKKTEPQEPERRGQPSVHHLGTIAEEADGGEDERGPPNIPA